MFGGYSQISSNRLLNAAKSDNALYKYSNALSDLDKAKKYWSLPATKRGVSKLYETTKTWQSFSTKVTESDVAFNTKDYSHALELLKDTPADYPQVKDVQRRRDAIKIKTDEIAVAKAAADAKLAADQAAKEAALKLRAAQAKRSVVAKAVGKRFSDTSAKTAVANAASVSAVESALTTFLSQYGSVAKTTNMPQSIYGAGTTWALLTESDLSAFKNLATVFIDEWAKYPIDFVKATGLESVNFVKYVTVNGQQRTAMPGNPSDHRMWYGTGAGGGIVHHEFAHYFEVIFMGSLSWGANEWKAYNPAGFTYGAGGATAYGAAPKYAQYQHPISGFVTEYGTYGIEEDRAELHSYLMTASYYTQLKSWLTTDTNLQGKVAIYKAMLQSHSASMGGTYFDDINK